jgi:hypothetical protein
MRPYETDDVTLDPGLTLLALRGLGGQSRGFPFLERYARRRRPHVRAMPPSERAAARWLVAPGAMLRSRLG